MNYKFIAILFCIIFISCEKHRRCYCYDNRVDMIPWEHPVNGTKNQKEKQCAEYSNMEKQKNVYYGCSLSPRY